MTAKQIERCRQRLQVYLEVMLIPLGRSERRFGPGADKPNVLGPCQTQGQPIDINAEGELLRIVSRGTLFGSFALSVQQSR